MPKQSYRPRAAHTAARVYQIKPGVVRRSRRAGSPPEDLAALFDLGPFDRNQITRGQIDKLRNWVDTEGLPTVCKELEMDGLTIMRVCAGFAHRLMPRSAAKLRAFFAERKS